MSNYTFMLTAIAALIAVAALLAATTIVMRIALRSPLGDSPWFWVCVFSTSAAVALFVMDGKYRHRQDHIENAYLYGTKTLAKPTRDATLSQAPESSAKADEFGDEAVPQADGPQPPTHDLLISLAPLRILAFAAMIVSGIALFWQAVRGTNGKEREKNATERQSAAGSPPTSAL